MFTSKLPPFLPPITVNLSVNILHCDFKANFSLTFDCILMLVAPQWSVVGVVLMSVNHDAQFSHYHAVGHQVVIYGFDYLDHGIMTEASFIRVVEFCCSFLPVIHSRNSSDSNFPSESLVRDEFY